MSFEFSFRGAVRISKLIDRCEELNMPVVALTDNGTMFGSLGFYLKARAKGINPIIGCELYVTPDINEKVRARQRLIILCKNFEGIKTLSILFLFLMLTVFIISHVLT